MTISDLLTSSSTPPARGAARVYFFLSMVVLHLGFACQEIDKEQFIKNFQALSNIRIEFRRSMKALGDSTYAHRDFARKAASATMADTALDRFFEPRYVAYNDSLRSRINMGLAFFEEEFNLEKPLIDRWEKMDMRFDQVVEAMKNGDLTEKEGLDSLQAFQKKLREVIVYCDSIEKRGTRNYWDFRRTWDEYQYNLRNLKVLYGNKIYRQ